MTYAVSILYFLLGFGSEFVTEEQSPGHIAVKGANQVMQTRVHYENSDLMRPFLILPAGDTVDASTYIKTDEGNSQLAESRKAPQHATPKSDRLVALSSFRMYREFLVALYGQDRWKDLLVWKRVDSVFILSSILPAKVLGNFSSASTADTIAIGYLREDEGSMNGGNWYFLLPDTGLVLVKQEHIQGTVPFGGDSNPVKGVRTIRYYVRFFDGSGTLLRDTLWYDCRRSDGTLVYARAAAGTVDLYRDGYWGREFMRVKPDSPKFRIGLSAYLGGVSYVYIEYRGRWYLTPRTQIIIDE